MLKKLYQKSELSFALVWIALYVAVMNIAMQFADGFDHLADKTVSQLWLPVACIAALAAVLSVWIVKNGLGETFGLCRFKGKAKDFLWFLPLVLMSATNLKNGLALNAPWALSILMMLNMALAGYVEEIIFRGFLFRAMSRDNLKSAVIVSAVTFGAGHIVNLANTADTTGVILQVCYAIVIGFLYTVIVYRGGSLWPCILSHMFVNGSSVFASEQGPFTEWIATVFPHSAFPFAECISAVLLMMVSGSYALWLWKKAR